MSEQEFEPVSITTSASGEDDVVDVPEPELDARAKRYGLTPEQSELLSLYL